MFCFDGKCSLKSFVFACGNIIISFLGLISLRNAVSRGGLSRAFGVIAAMPYNLWGKVSKTTSAEIKKHKIK